MKQQTAVRIDKMTGFCRNIAVSILLLLCLGVQTGSCQDFLVAKVLDIDVERMEVEVASVGRATAPLSTKAGESVHVQVAAKNSLPQEN